MSQKPSAIQIRQSGPLVLLSRHSRRSRAPKTRVPLEPRGQTPLFLEEVSKRCLFEGLQLAGLRGV